MDCFCDYEPAIIYNRATRKARKPHRCDECGGNIAVGQYHEVVDAMWDRSIGFETARTCSLCLDLRKFVTASVPCFCWAHGNMLEDARDTVQDAYERAGDEVCGLFMGYGRRRVAIDRARRGRRS